MPDAERNCPFYGHHMVLLPRGAAKLTEGSLTLLNSFGNQCGLITASYSPCQLEIAGEPVEWRVCPIVARSRVGDPA